MSKIGFFMGGVTGSLIKWALIAVLWICSVVFVTTNALALDAISDAMLRFAGIPTIHLDQKRKVAKAQTDLTAQKNQTARAKTRLNEERAMRKRAIKNHSSKVSRFVSKMAVRNVSDGGQSLIPVVGGLVSIPLAVADVYAACEMVDMQNDLNVAFNLENELSEMEAVCVTAVNQMEELEHEAELKLEEMKETGQQVAVAVDTAGETLSETMNEWKEQVPTAEEMQRSAEKQWCRVTGNC